MGAHLRRLAWVLGLVFLSPLEAAETLSSEEWVQALVRHELSALEAAFRGLAEEGQVSSQKLRLTTQTSRRLRQDLQENNPDLPLQSLRYVALTDYLGVARLRGLCGNEGKCHEKVDQAEAEVIAVFHSVTGENHPDNQTMERALARLHQAEAITEVAQKGILLVKRAEAVRSTSLRLQILEQLEPAKANNYRDASFLIRRSLGDFEREKQAQGEAHLSKAVHLAFGGLAEQWDGRHLLHYLQLKILALSVNQSDRLKAEEKAAVLEKLEALERASDATTYDRQATDLRNYCLGLVSAKELDVHTANLLVKISPERAQESLVARLGAMRAWLPEVEDGFKKNETFLQSFQTNRNRQSLSILRQMDKRFKSAAAAVGKNEDFRTLERFYGSTAILQTLTLFTAEAVLDRSDCAQIYFGIWYRGMDRLTKGMPYLSEADSRRLQVALKTERREGVRRAWLNRHNATVAALGVLLAAEAVAIPFTGGGSAAAMPATLHAVMTISVVTAKTVVIANSALNLADRGKIHGVKGLATMDSAFDALLILTMAPRPMVGGAPARGFVGKMEQWGLKRLSMLQYTAGMVLGAGAPAYGAYLVWNAQSISQDMLREGVVISPQEVRRKGLVNIALGMLALRENANYYRKGLEQNGGRFQKAMEPATLTQGTGTGLLKHVRQVQTLRNYWAAHPSLFGKLMTGMKGLGYAVYDYLLVTEGLIFSYSNLDSKFLDHVATEHPLPDLHSGESAVILVGFDPADYFLYAGAQAAYSNRREISKYGSRLFLYEYTSPENLMDVLDRHSSENGPVRYLKIATHGRPGRIYSRAVSDNPDGDSVEGWIDRQWLYQEEGDLKRRSGEIFAADARIVLWACLVGANLDEDAGEGKDVGERFVEAMGNVWLVKGGAIDASTRILMGVDAVLGPVSHEAMVQGLSPLGKKRPRLTLPVSALLASEDTENGTGVGGLPTPVPWTDRLAATMDMGKALAHRMVTIFMHWPAVWWEYGVNLEGPFWQSRYRYREFQPAICE